MCGIAGVLSANGWRHDRATAADQMAAALHHRGPDGLGSHESATLSLRTRRLAIVDRAGPGQPFESEDGRFVAVANGEIYNHAELRRMLARRGHKLRTGNDCEVLPHLAEEFGADMVRHLRGMFAFALWDRAREQLVLGRDRLGEKPLYLYRDDENRSLVFASELGALLSSGLVPMELNPRAVDCYFHFQYVPEPHTPLLGVHKLPPASLLVLDSRQWQVSQRRYWSLHEVPPLEGDPVESISAELAGVAETITQGDGQIGVALSGGVDSALTAAVVRSAAPDTVAFSVGFEGRPKFDERSAAGEIASHLGLEFVDIQLTDRDVVDGFPALVRATDDPIADMSGFGYAAIAQAASRQSIRVLVQGQGGDELFWGYDWVRKAYHTSKTLRDQAVPIAMEAGRCAHTPDLPAWLQFYELVPDYRLSCGEVERLYQPEFHTHLVDASPREALGPLSSPDLPVEFTRLAVETYLLENGIAQGDRLAMASSVELRLPLLDYRLVERVVAARRAQPDVALPPKQWLRHVAADWLPEHIAWRPKQPFEVPRKRWHALLFQRHGPTLVDGALVRAGVLRPEAARCLAEGPLRQGVISSTAYKALVLEHWLSAVAALPGRAAQGASPSMT